MTPLDLAQNLAQSDRRSDRVLGVAILARGLSDDDGLRQGWPLASAIPAAARHLGLTEIDPAFVADVARVAPTVSDAMLNKGAASR